MIITLPLYSYSSGFFCIRLFCTVSVCVWGFLPLFCLFTNNWSSMMRYLISFGLKTSERKNGFELKWMRKPFQKKCNALSTCLRWKTLACNVKGINMKIHSREFDMYLFWVCLFVLLLFLLLLFLFVEVNKWFSSFHTFKMCVCAGIPEHRIKKRTYRKKAYALAWILFFFSLSFVSLNSCYHLMLLLLSLLLEFSLAHFMTGKLVLPS